MIIRFKQNFGRGSYDVYAFQDCPGGRRPYRITLEVLPVVDDMVLIEPAIRLRQIERIDFVNALLEGLTEAGLIPQMGATQAELVATKRHLEDLRALTFDEVKPKAAL